MAFQLNQSDCYTVDDASNGLLVPKSRLVYVLLNEKAEYTIETKKDGDGALQVDDERIFELSSQPKAEFADREFVEMRYFGVSNAMEEVLLCEQRHSDVTEENEYVFNYNHTSGAFNRSLITIIAFNANYRTRVQKIM